MTDDAAMRAIAAMRAELARRGAAGTMAVADAHGELVALLRLDGADLATGPIAANKAFTAARLRKPTSALGVAIRERGHELGYYGDARYTGFGGGLPVLAADGRVLGAVAVSGLSQVDDEAVASIGVAAIAADALAG